MQNLTSMSQGGRSLRLLHFAILLLPSLASGQAFFDVASIKLHDPKDKAFSPPTCEGARFRVRTGPVSQVLAWAYDLRPDQFQALEASLPFWARMEPYDFEATASGLLQVARCKVMVQQLFSDRFKMTFHWKRVTNSPGYELRVSTKGHKLKPASSTDTGCGVHISYQGRERPCDRYQWPFGPKRAISMDDFARILSIYTSKEPVRNLTGLSGEYKLSLSFALRSDDPRYPSLETALQEQLGLVLRRVNGEVDILIVDSISRPTAN